MLAVYSAEYVIHNEGDTGRQHSIFSSTNDLSLGASTTANTLSQIALHEKVDRQVTATKLARECP